MLSIVREQGGEGSAPVVVGGGWLSADLPCYCPELYGSYPAVPGTLSQPGGEGSGCVCVCVCVCVGGGGGLSADLPCYCPESCGSSPAVPGTLPQCADAHVEV